MNTLFLAWQAPQSRRWYPIGRLDRTGGVYRFAYTEGVRAAQAESEFRPLVSFPDLHTVYQSDEIFPLFANRVLSPNRPDYGEFVEWLSLTEHEADPMAILARSGGHRSTDRLEIFPCPSRADGGPLRVHFFVHGLRHQTPQAQERVTRLEPGERLRLCWDQQNTRDDAARNLRTDEVEDGDMHYVGYLPRYLAHDVGRLPIDADTPRVEVERVNPAAPIHFRLLCRMTADWPDGFEPFEAPEYRPLAASAEAERPATG